MDWILGILTLVLPVTTGAVSYMLGKKKRNNDFLNDLQGSIDLLTTNYIKALNELTELRSENLELRTMQNKMLIEMKALKSENARLTEVVMDLTEKLDKIKSFTPKKN